MVDLAGCILCFQEWHGLPVDDRIKTVIYACGEDHDGITASIQAWEQMHGEKFPEDRVKLVPTVPDLMDQESVNAWVTGSRTIPLSKARGPFPGLA